MRTTSKTANGGNARPARQMKPNLIRTLLIVGYIAAVLLFSGLARANVNSQGAERRYLDEVSSILGLN